MNVQPILQTWGRVLVGRVPSLSIEVTRECPLRCPGCYAYEEGHLNQPGVTLRTLSDMKGGDLVAGVLRVVDEHKPLHVSLVGGDPLVRYREMTALLPQLVERGIFVQVVTSAFRQIPPEWATLKNAHVVVSIDGLQPEHDVRRTPATYDRILKNIEGQHIVVHCTITGQMMKRPGYLAEFISFWAANPNVAKIWMSMFTPQRGAISPECLTQVERERAVEELMRLRREHEKLDMREGMLREFLRPPKSPAECIFALTTHCISADLKTKITPCQFGGDPDCSQCGCIASMGLSAIGKHRIAGAVTAGAIFHASVKVGNRLVQLKRAAASK